MDKSHPLVLAMAIWSLDMKKYLFCQLKDGENIFDHEVQYLSMIGSLICPAIVLDQI